MSQHRHQCADQKCVAFFICDCKTPDHAWYCQHHRLAGIVQVVPDPKEHVNHPTHYGGKDNPYETIKVIRAWDLGFSLGNAIKYISRAGKKDPAKNIEDLKKAAWYLKDEIEFLEKEAASIVKRNPNCSLHGGSVQPLPIILPTCSCEKTT